MFKKDISKLKLSGKIKKEISKNSHFSQINPVMMSVIALSTLLLTSCSDAPTSVANKPTYVANKLVNECKTELSDKKSLCAEAAIQNIEDEYIRGCVEVNIDGKKSLADKMSNNTVDDNDLDDIDKVSRECLYFKESTKASGTNYPLFPNFISSLAGSFAGSYLSDTLFNSRTKGANGYYMPTSNGGSTGGNETAKTIQNNYKANSWDIKTFKSSSASKTNWSVGSTGAKWGSSASRKSSSPSSWGSSKGGTSSFGGGGSSMG